MKAVILVGGEATRLRPLTQNIPKAMVPVLNRPFLEYVIRNLHSHQVRDIILTQSHFASPIKDYFQDGSQFDVKLTYVIEDSQMGTAGAVKNAGSYLNSTFLVLNGDIFNYLDIMAMIAFHRASKAMATISLTPVADPTSYGLIETDAANKVTRFLEKPAPEQVTTNMINSGTYILEPEILNLIPSGARFSFERDLFPLLLEQGEPVYAYPSNAYWIDIGTTEKYLKLNLDLLGDSNLNTHAKDKDFIVTGEQSFIDPKAHIQGPVVIGNNCNIENSVKLIGPVVIGPGCTVLEDSVVEASVIWRDTCLGKNVTLRNSVIADSCHLSDGITLDSCILGDNVTVAGGSVMEPGSKIEPGTVYP